MRADLEHLVIDLRDAAPAAPAQASTTPATPLLDDETHRLVRVIALSALIVLNLLDIVTTSAFLQAGVPEGNPIAAAGIEAGWIGVAKAGLLLALGVRILNVKPRLSSTCALWFVTGVYAAVVAVNVAALHAAGGTLL